MFEITPISPFNKPVPRGISKLSKDILRTLLYYNIFNYPLTADEIFNYCSLPYSSVCNIIEALEELESRNLVKNNAGLYYLGNESLITRRKSGNLLAKQFLHRARLMTSLIAHFPFVKCVCISGSLSKGYMDKNGDVDYFIITTPQRLWLCRSLLMLFKKMFLLNSKKYFCINYFISADNLEIPDKNIFTATEIATLIPLYNLDLYNSFISANKWIEDFYPNHANRFIEKEINSGKSILKKITENLLSRKIGEWLDTYFFKLTLRYWRKKFPQFNYEEFDLNLRSRKNVSKHHPRGFQYKVLEDYETAIKNYEVQFNVQLS